MKPGDRVKIVRGPYNGATAEVVRKVCGDNDGWICRSDELPGVVMVYENEARPEPGKDGR